MKKPAGKRCRGGPGGLLARRACLLEGEEAALESDGGGPQGDAFHSPRAPQRALLLEPREVAFQLGRDDEVVTPHPTLVEEATFRVHGELEGHHILGPRRDGHVVTDQNSPDFRRQRLAFHVAHGNNS